jgi:hypothetical protein
MVFAGVNSSGSATEYMRIKTGGNVGIGTTAPADQLSVAKSTGTSISITTGGISRHGGFSKEFGLGFSRLSELCVG